MADSNTHRSAQAGGMSVDRKLQSELLAMVARDESVRAELASRGELENGYAPEMEAVHRANAGRLMQIVAERGWPDHAMAGKRGAWAAWLIAQHAIGDPAFQRASLHHIEGKVRQGKLPSSQAAYLSDRIAMYEGRPQTYGTQSLPCADGQTRRWDTHDPAQLNRRRAQIGLPPVADDPALTEPSPEALAEYQQWLQGYEAWLRKAGWRETNAETDAL